MERPQDPKNEPITGTEGQAQAWPHAALRGVTLRAIALAALLAPLNIYWNFHLQSVTAVGNPTILSLYYNVVFSLAVLAVLNVALRKVAPRAALSQAELLVVYVLVSIGVSTAGCDYFHWIFPNIAGLHYRATPENRWEEIFFQWVPHYLTVQDERSLKWLYEGGVSFYQRPEAWRPWITPTLWWTGLLSLMLLAPLGLGMFFRRRWIEVEKLTFPIVQLPFEMTRQKPRAFADRAMWIAFGIVCGINLLNGLNALKPIFPAIPIKVGWDPGGGEGFYISPSITDAPWSSATYISLGFYPIIIGLGLLIPSELAFSCFFFFWFFKLQQVGTTWLGLNTVPEFPYLKEQSLGGYLGIIVFALWIGRRYYKGLLRQVVRLRRSPDEPVSLTGAAGLFVVCFGGLVILALIHGMGLWPAVFHWSMYLILTLVVGRIRAEMGMPTHEIERLGPTVLLGNNFGVKLVGERSLTVASVYFSLSRGMRSIPFPHQMEGFKLMDRAGGDQRRLFFAMGGAAVVGSIMAWLIYLQVVYQYGAEAKMTQFSNWHTNETYAQLVNWLEDPKGLSVGRIVPTLLGLVFYVAMMTLNTRLPWWPIHPVGFALSSTWYMHHMWCPLAIAWVVKTLVTRYGGQAGVKRLVPIAYGLILGDTISGCLWTLYGMFTHQEVYGFWS